MVKSLHKLIVDLSLQYSYIPEQNNTRKFSKSLNDMISSATLTSFTGMISRIDDNFMDLAFNEIILNVCKCFVGPPESLLCLSGRNEMEQSSRFLNALRRLMRKFINSVKFRFPLILEQVHLMNPILYNNVAVVEFEKEWYFLCIIQDLYHKVRHLRSIEPPVNTDIDEYSILILPALLILEDVFMVLRNRHYDFICCHFYGFEDFKIANDREQIFKDNDYIPLHPCNGPLENSLIDKGRMIIDILDDQNLKTESSRCLNCPARLANITQVAVWDGCQHWYMCVDCAEKAFFGLIDGDSIQETGDGNVAATLVVKSKKCRLCSNPITKWTKGKYILESFDMHETVPSPLCPFYTPYFERWYANLFNRIRNAYFVRLPISFIFALLFHPLTCYLDKLEEVHPTNRDRMHKIFFGSYERLLEGFPGNLNMGSPFLAEYNLICIEKAFDDFAQLIGSSVTLDLNGKTLSCIESIRGNILIIRNAFFRY